MLTGSCLILDECVKSLLTISGADAHTHPLPLHLLLSPVLIPSLTLSIPTTHPEEADSLCTSRG